MEFNNLLTDDDAVSPVIGVILMVAITVILAAVIGTFVLGLGDQVQETPPNANFDWDEKSSGDVELTHESGDKVNVERVEVVGASNNSPHCDSGTAWDGLSNSKVTAGSSCTIPDGDTSDGDTLRLVWSSESGDQSSSLAQYEY